MHSMADQASIFYDYMTSSNIGHAWRPSAPPPVSFRVFIYQHTGRNFERADFTEHLQEHPVGNEQCLSTIRNAIHPEDSVPEDYLQCADLDTIINNQLSKFIVETRKTNRAQYQPATLHSLLCGILRCMRESNPVGCPCKLPKDTRFRTLRRSLL